MVTKGYRDNLDIVLGSTACGLGFTHKAVHFVGWPCHLFWPYTQKYAAAQGECINKAHTAVQTYHFTEVVGEYLFKYTRS